ncbi:MAG: aminodeoxychorismate/anthranilate synthase component II [Caldithrix sp.]|nr:aminodeoxychorismate/anthranilate synthase component II [Caldithrix sp.]
MLRNIILIDNYDSFTHNLRHALMAAGADVPVHRNDDPQLTAKCHQCLAVVISPGPSNPDNSGYCKQIVRQFYQHKPFLGVCLGMQILNEVFGGTTGKASIPVHGKTTMISALANDRLFKGINLPIRVARYHSLYCDRIADSFKVTAYSGNVPMAVTHLKYPIYGVQFHPESFMTPQGQEIINRFVGLIK